MSVPRTPEGTDPPADPDPIALALARAKREQEREEQWSVWERRYRILMAEADTAFARLADTPQPYSADDLLERFLGVGRAMVAIDTAPEHPCPPGPGGRKQADPFRYLADPRNDHLPDDARVFGYLVAIALDSPARLPDDLKRLIGTPVLNAAMEWAGCAGAILYRLRLGSGTAGGWEKLPTPPRSGRDVLSFRAAMACRPPEWMVKERRTDVTTEPSLPPADKVPAARRDPDQDRRDESGPSWFGNTLSMSAALRELAHRFKRADESWPGLRHTLVEKTEGSESLGIQNATALVPSGEGIVWLILYQSVGPPFAHVFWGLAHDEGNKAFAEFCRLAELAVKLLVDADRLPAQAPPDAKIPVCVQNHWAGRLMVFVHRLAQQNHRGSLLRADRQSVLEGWGEGTLASVLPLSVFDGVAVALKMVADDVERPTEHDDPSTSDAPRHVSHILRDLLKDTVDYCRGLSAFAGRGSGCDVVADSERSLAHAMRRLLCRILEFEKAPKGREGKLLGFDLERRIKGLKSNVLGQSVRWAWDAYMDPRMGGALVEQRYRERRKLKEEPCRRACLTWRWNADLNEPRADVDENPWADKIAAEALLDRLQSIPLTSQEAKELCLKLWREWHDDPVLGDSLPSPKSDEVRDVETLVYELRKSVPTIAPPEPATPPAPTKPPPIDDALVKGSDDDESPDEKNRKVGEYLDKHKNATSLKVGRALGYPAQTVRGMRAWKNRPATQKPAKQPKPNRERPLTEEMLAVIPGRDSDPSEIAANNEESYSIARARYVDTLNDHQRAEFNGLKQEVQLERIGEFLANEGTGEVPPA
jgi:hypothetical protein